MRSATVSAATEALLVEKLLQVADRINRKTADLQNAIAGAVHWLPPVIGDKVAAGWTRFCDVIHQIWDFWHEVRTNMGSPSKLWATADAWSDSVGGQVSGQVQSADAGLLTVDDNWNGDAADAYRQTLPLQKVALDKVKTTLTDGISAALSEVAKGIIAFWASLVVALAALVCGIISALASTATIFGLPAAPVIATGAALAAGAAVTAGGMLLTSVCSSADTMLRQKLNDNAGFHEGHWPPAATY